MHRSHSLKTALKTCAVICATALVLFVSLAWPEHGGPAPVFLEPFVRAAYRLSFLIVLPVRVLVMPYFPPANHHWSLAHTFLTSLFTPLFMVAAWKLIQNWKRRVAHKRMPTNDRKPAWPIGRRTFLLQTGAAAVHGVLGGAAAYTALLEPQRLCVRRYTVPIPDLPAALNGFRLVHLSDTHYGPFVSSSYLEDVIQQAAALEPDLAVLTGDYVHRTPTSISRGIGLFGDIQSRLGAVAVLGNHEHWEGADTCRQRFREINIPLLDNRRLFLTPDGLSPIPALNHSICVAGVGDLWEDDVLFGEALRDVPDNMPRLVLSHNPDAAEWIGAEHRVDLMLSGHTHGGQVSLPLIGPTIVPIQFKQYTGGLCRGPHCPVIVSRGVGLAGLPVRFRVPPELCLIKLEQA